MNEVLACEEDGGYTVRLAEAVYSVAAVKKAAYRYSGHLHILVEQPAPGSIIVRLRPKNPGGDSAMLACDFLNELLDQDLRERIAAETSGIRDLIIAQAFSQVSLFHPDLDGTPEEPE